MQDTHSHLTKIFQKYWDTPLEEFSNLLYKKEVEFDLEEILLESFQEEWLSMGASQHFVEQARHQLEKQPVLQTSQHITPTNGPTFLAVDLISLAGLQSNQRYLVGATSGIPFSNSAWSGALSYDKIPLNSIVREGTSAFKKTTLAMQERQNHGDSELRISLIPSKWRDRLVHTSSISSFQVELAQQLTEKCQDQLAPLQLETPYSHWAAKTCSRIQNKVLNSQQIFYFDISQVIRRYLIKVFSEKPQHPLFQIFFQTNIKEAVQKAFGVPTLFLGSNKGKKSFKLQPLQWKEQGFFTNKGEHFPMTPEDLVEKLENREICPSLLLKFFILRFLNGIHCLGSYKQIEYIEDYRKTWESLSPLLNWKMDLQHNSPLSLTTGRLFIDQQAQYPFDLALQNQSLDRQALNQKPMSYYWVPISQKLQNS